jgi:hypothetical protein
MWLPLWVSESRMPAHDRRQANISNDTLYTGDYTTQNSNVDVSVVLPLVAIFCGFLFLIAAIFVTTKVFGVNNQTPLRNLTPSQPRQRIVKGTPQVLSVTSLGSIPIIKFNSSDQLHCRTGQVPETGFTQDEGTETITMNTAAKQRSSDSPESAADSQGQCHAKSAGPERPASNKPRHRQPSWAGMSISCSICDDDFEHGQDVRLLPCNHGYHPICVDSWLLERSATCPLWYIPLVLAFKTYWLIQTII